MADFSCVADPTERSMAEFNMGHFREYRIILCI